MWSTRCTSFARRCSSEGRHLTNTKQGCVNLLNTANQRYRPWDQVTDRARMCQHVPLTESIPWTPAETYRDAQLWTIPGDIWEASSQDRAMSLANFRGQTTELGVTLKETKEEKKQLSQLWRNIPSKWSWILPSLWQDLQHMWQSQPIFISVHVKRQIKWNTKLGEATAEGKEQHSCNRV